MSDYYSDSDDDDEICGSVLGTKEYWETAYGRDLENYESTDDAGEIWFGRPCQDRMIKWIRDHSEIDSESAQILDLGCGNGAMTIALRRNGFKNVTGVDYAPTAITLAQCVAKKDGFSDVHFQVCNILAGNTPDTSNLEHKFDILLDKGTYDAIGLMENGIEARQKYKQRVVQFISPSSPHRLLVIASCNSTKDELLHVFQPEFAFLDEIVAPTRMVFGGQTGSTVSTLVLQLRVNL